MNLIDLTSGERAKLREQIDFSKKKHNKRIPRVMREDDNDDKDDRAASQASQHTCTMEESTEFEELNRVEAQIKMQQYQK
uniref:Uncharacterized protein n=1 Tax=Parascaris equorum TaxID=6256 RepID=A0A914RVJ7_PAREQ